MLISALTQWTVADDDLVRGLLNRRIRGGLGAKAVWMYVDSSQLRSWCVFSSVNAAVVAGDGPIL